MTPSSTGTFSTGWQDYESGSLKNPAGGGVAFAIGTIPDEGFIAVSGIVPGTDVGVTPTSGAATFSGQYRVLEVTNVTIADSGTVSGTSNGTGGSITLHADFDAGTVIGTSGELDINGVILPTRLDGSVDWRGHQGLLDGLVDGNRAIGAFHGANDTIVFSGGFVTD